MFNVVELMEFKVMILNHPEMSNKIIFKTPACTFLKRTKQEQQIKHSLQNEL